MLFFDNFYDIYFIKYYTVRIKRTYRHLFPKKEFIRRITISASNMGFNTRP